MAYNRLSTYKTRVLDWGDGMWAVQYHETLIVKTYSEHGRRVIELNTGGETGDWQTPSRAVGSVTTKRKMNQAARQFDLPYQVHQHKHRWYVTTKAGVHPMDDTVFVFDAETGIEWGAFDALIGKESPCHRG